MSLAQDEDANDGSATNCHGNVPLLDYARIIFKHRSRRLANPLDVAFECCADACQYQWDIGLRCGTKKDCTHVPATVPTKVGGNSSFALHIFMLLLQYLCRSAAGPFAPALSAVSIGLAMPTKECSVWGRSRRGSTRIPS